MIIKIEQVVGETNVNFNTDVSPEITIAMLDLFKHNIIHRLVGGLNDKKNNQDSAKQNG